MNGEIKFNENGDVVIAPACDWYVFDRSGEREPVCRPSDNVPNPEPKNVGGGYFTGGLLLSRVVDFSRGYGAPKNVRSIYVKAPDFPSAKKVFDRAVVELGLKDGEGEEKDEDNN